MLVTARYISVKGHHRSTWENLWVLTHSELFSASTDAQCPIVVSMERSNSFGLSYNHQWRGAKLTSCANSDPHPCWPLTIVFIATEIIIVLVENCLLFAWGWGETALETKRLPQVQVRTLCTWNSGNGVRACHHVTFVSLPNQIFQWI